MNAPEGWKLVPLEPTREMLQAVHDGPLGADEHPMTAEVEAYLIASYKVAVEAAPAFGVLACDGSRSE